MRVLGVDVGLRRIGLAVSDDSATLARPWQMIAAEPTPVRTADHIVRLLADERCATLDDFAVGAIVVGLPRRLNGDDTDATKAARGLAEVLGQRSGLPVFLQDERLTSREAESILAAREPDWRARKRLIDATAAAILLQDYLDQHRNPVTAGRTEP